MAHKDKYCSFDELRKYEDSEDYGTVVSERDSDVLILTPHGGKIEPRTSEIAQRIAGEDYSLYLFEGRKNHCNYATLHITSSRFDEPKCLRIVASAEVVVAIHGCRGAHKAVYLGGLDEALRDQLTDALRDEGYEAQAQGHQYPGKHPRNICNLGNREAGVQIEITWQLRRELDIEAFAAVIREVLGTR